MYKYERIIYWSEDDNAFLVEVPELPGCMADGETVGNAIANAEVVIREWLEVAKERGQEIPEPKGKLVYAQSSSHSEDKIEDDQKATKKAGIDFDTCLFL